ncbi:MAG: thioredoxin TrxC [Burkholderiales bacterium]|nr:thioredoxin TrxC [Burkholderiales bacterium]
MREPVHIVCPHCGTTNRLPRERLAERPACGKCKAPLFDGHPAALGEADFDRHVGKSDIPVVVDFWAAWCGPCKMMAPQFERAAQELEPHVRLAKLDTEAAQGIAARYGIRSIPTMIAFKGGREIARQSGAMDAASIVRWVRGAVGG